MTSPLFERGRGLIHESVRRRHASAATKGAKRIPAGPMPGRKAEPAGEGGLHPPSSIDTTAVAYSLTHSEKFSGKATLNA